MYPESAAAEGASLRDHLRVVLRRKWIILLALVTVPTVAVILSMRQEALYQATSQVLLNRQNLSGILSGVTDPNTYYQPERLAQTQAELARVPEVGQRVITAAGLTDRTPAGFLGSSSVVAEPDSDLIDFTVVDTDRATAAKLANTYASVFTQYRSELDGKAIQLARQGVSERIDELEAQGDTSSVVYRTLVDKEQQLQTIEALQTSTLSVVREATRASQIQPRPFRNGVFGLLLGLAIGIVLAFVWETLDTRVRKAEEIAEQLGLPLLARLPQPRRGLRNKNRLATVDDPNGAAAEAFRMLRTNLDFTNIDRAAKTIMITSAVESEGKSTTIANLAVTLARGGRRVAIVDLDLRRPYLDRFFGLQGAPGLTQVALGHVDLDQALARIPITVDRPTTGRELNGHQNGNGNGSDSPLEAILEVLPAGPIPPDPGEFSGSHAVEAILKELGERVDFVLVDAPPILHVGDAMALSAHVDGLIVVGRLKIVRRPMLAELRRLLAVAPAAKLGVVVTGAQGEEGYGYGSYYYARTTKRSKVTGRRKKETVT
jgi:succinoglycan biosynthesis transport protein ExoP